MTLLLCEAWHRSASYCITRYGIIDDQKTEVIAIGPAARRFLQDHGAIVTLETDGIIGMRIKAMQNKLELHCMCMCIIECLGPSAQRAQLAGVFGDDLIIVVTHLQDKHVWTPSCPQIC